MTTDPGEAFQRSEIVVVSIARRRRGRIVEINLATLIELLPFVPRRRQFRQRRTAVEEVVVHPSCER